MFLDYLPRETYLHQLDIRTKILGFIAITFTIFLFDNPLYNLAGALLIVLLAQNTGLPWKKVGSIIFPLLPIYLMILFFTGFTPADKFISPTDQQILLNIWPRYDIMLTVGGLLKGCTLLLRILVMIIGASLISLTTPIDDFIQLFNLMKLPAEFSFLITTALRFIPTMNRKRQLIIEAQRSRGANLQEKGLIAPVKTMIPIMVPMMTGSIMLANNLSKAMLNRGFGATMERRALKKIAFQGRDYFGCFVIVVVVIVGVYVRFGLKLGRL